jgi:hypothetical protein
MRTAGLASRRCSPSTRHNTLKLALQRRVAFSNIDWKIDFNSPRDELTLPARVGSGGQEIAAGSCIQFLGLAIYPAGLQRRRRNQFLQQRNAMRTRATSTLIRNVNPRSRWNWSLAYARSCAEAAKAARPHPTLSQDPKRAPQSDDLSIDESIAERPLLRRGECALSL